MESTPFTAPPEATTEMPVADAPTAVHAPLSVAADSCAACGAHLAVDQRYCVECGQPRGAARLPAPSAAPARAPAPAGTVSPPGRWSANTALIAGIGTLLLAMGIGVFIGSQGRTDTSGAARAPTGETVTVISSGGAAAPSAASAAPAAAAPAASAAGATAAAKAATKKATAAPVKKKPAPPVVHVGTPGTGPGYQNGKFTGNFF